MAPLNNYPHLPAGSCYRCRRGPFPLLR